MRQQKQKENDDIKQITLLAKELISVNGEIEIYNFKMPECINHMKYVNEGKLLLEQARIAIEILNNQSRILQQQKAQNTLKSQELEKKSEEETKALKRELEKTKEKLNSPLERFNRILNAVNEVNEPKPTSHSQITAAQPKTAPSTPQITQAPQVTTKTSSTQKINGTSTKPSLNRKNTKQTSARNRQPRAYCNYCNRIGHNAIECRHRITDIRKSQQKPKKIKRSQVKCVTCSKQGHRAEHCYFNKPKPSFLTKNHLIKNTKIDIISAYTKLEGERLTAALDNASHISILSQATAEKIGIRYYPTNKMIETSTGNIVKAVGTTGEIEIQIEDARAKVSLVITQLESYDILLGLDWFAQTGVILDPKNQTFKVPEENIMTIIKVPAQIQKNEIKRATIMTAEQKAHIDKLQSFNQI